MNEHIITKRLDDSGRILQYLNKIKHILDTHKDLLGGFQPSVFQLLTSEIEYELLNEFDLIADDYQLNILSNPKKKLKLLKLKLKL